MFLASHSIPHINNSPDITYWEKIWNVSRLGCVYAQRGKKEAAKAQLKELDRLDALYDERHAYFKVGSIPNLKARIYAILGEKDLAVKQLCIAIEQHRTLGYWNISFDQDLVNLKGYPPFEELIKPRG